MKGVERKRNSILDNCLNNIMKQFNILVIQHFSFQIQHCVKSVRIRSFSGPYFPASGLNTERLQSECGKIQTRKTPNTDTLYAV